MKVLTKQTVQQVFIALFFVGCQFGVKSGNELTQEEINYIQGLDLLEKDEQIIQFHSQSGEYNELKQAGNFYTEKRVAAYWIDEKDSSRTNISTAYYPQIDTIIPFDNTNDWEYSSYLEVKTFEADIFRIYVNGDSSEVWSFFRGLLDNWNKRK